MYAVTVRFTLHEGRQGDFLPLKAEDARSSLLEAASRQVDVCSDPSRPDTVFLNETYDELAGFRAYQETPHIKSSDKKVGEIITGKKIACFEGVVR